jgi:ankyrin repeat protein
MDGFSDEPPKNTTLITAVSNNDMEAAKTLLESGADVNERVKLSSMFGNTIPKFGKKTIGEKFGDKGNTPLHLAVIRNSPDMASLLLEYGAHVNEKNRSGNTSLHLAKGKDAEIAKLLLEKGADINSTNSNGRTPLDENPGLAELNRKVQNFEVRKPLIQLSKGTDTSSSPQPHYLQNEFVARDIASYIDRNTKGGKYKRKSRKYRKSRKSVY